MKRVQCKGIKRERDRDFRGHSGIGKDIVLQGAVLPVVCLRVPGPAAHQLCGRGAFPLLCSPKQELRDRQVQHLGSGPSEVHSGRAFVLPENEVRNYFIWRQEDATTNSLSMLAQSLYAHETLQHRK